jgi:hypothetical protein
MERLSWSRMRMSWSFRFDELESFLFRKDPFKDTTYRFVRIEDSYVSVDGMCSIPVVCVH